MFPVDVLLKRIEEKQAIGPTEVMGPQVCNVAPPETTEKNEEGTVGVLSGCL